MDESNQVDASTLGCDNDVCTVTTRNLREGDRRMLEGVAIACRRSRNEVARPGCC